MNAKRLTRLEWASGHTTCGCGRFAHIFRTEVLARLPLGYRGELCPECNAWVCALDKLEADPSPESLDEETQPHSLR